jgi:hypothetical protein
LFERCSGFLQSLKLYTSRKSLVCVFAMHVHAQGLSDVCDTADEQDGDTDVLDHDLLQGVKLSKSLTQFIILACRAIIKLPRTYGQVLLAPG